MAQEQNNASEVNTNTNTNTNKAPLSQFEMAYMLAAAGDVIAHTKEIPRHLIERALATLEYWQAEGLVGGDMSDKESPYGMAYNAFKVFADFHQQMMVSDETVRRHYGR